MSLNFRVSYYTIISLLITTVSTTPITDYISNVDNATCMKDNVSYGIDVSWPMSKLNVTTEVLYDSNNNNKNESVIIYPLGNRQEEYNTWMKGCYEILNKSYCDSSEYHRIDRIKRQPQSMVNYTSKGYDKIRAPDSLFKLIEIFWNNNKQNQTLEIDSGIINQWNSPSHLVSVGNDTLDGGGVFIMQKIWNEAQSVINEWVKEPLETTSVYGIRVYSAGAILSPHVDRLPLVSSAIINVAQDVDEPWPLEVIAHDGNAVNITMAPGDMILYESHSIIHGRPFPLKGRFYANIFIHFAPKKNHKYTPSYMLEMSPSHIFEINMRLKAAGNLPGYNIAHDAAYHDKIKTLIKLYASSSPQYLSSKDHKGWTPLYYAVVQGHDRVFKFLLTHGCAKGIKTSVDISGKTVLDVAKEILPHGHTILHILLASQNE